MKAGTPEKLHIGPELQADLEEVVKDRLIFLDFLCFVWGTSTGRPAGYAAGAATVWRVEGDGNPSPEIDLFPWGGDHLALPNLRVWYLRRSGSPPYGLGAFEESGGDFPEKDELLRRARVVLKADGCWFVSA